MSTIPLTEERFMQLMNMMNEKQCKKIEESVAGQLDTVKKDLTVAINKVSDRQDSMEEKQSVMQSQIDSMQEKIQNLAQSKEVSVISSEEVTTKYPGRSFATVAATTPTPAFTRPVNNSHTNSDHEKEVAEIVDLARRTVGLYKIDTADLKRMRLDHFGGATTEEEEKQFAVKEYLRCELKFNTEEIENMEVESIFIPAKDKGEPQSLNVTFKSVTSVNRIYEKTRIMRKVSRVINYIPRQFQDRLSAVSNIDFNIRADKKYQTRIKMGLYDLELHRKLRGTRNWERVPLPTNLPPVDLSSRPPPSFSDSPPPGRPGHEEEYSIKRSRDSSGSSPGQGNPKIAKQSEVADDDFTDKEKDDSFVQLVAKADLVTEGDDSSEFDRVKDPGTVTSVQGTPAKLLVREKFQSSPIIARSSKKNQD